jgi:hypothetical protein
MSRHGDQLSLRVDAQLLVDVLEMGLDGVGRVEELTGDLLRLEAALGQPADAIFSGSEGVRVDVLTVVPSACGP